MIYGPEHTGKYGPGQLVDQPLGELISRPAGGLHLPTNFLGLVWTRYASSWKKTNAAGGVIASVSEQSFAEWANPAVDAQNDTVVVGERGRNAQRFDYENFGANRTNLTGLSGSYPGVCVDPETQAAFILDSGGVVRQHSYDGTLINNFSVPNGNNGNEEIFGTNPCFARIGGVPFIYYVSRDEYLCRLNVNSGTFTVLVNTGQLYRSSCMYDPSTETIFVYDQSKIQAYAPDGTPTFVVTTTVQSQRDAAALDLVNMRIFGQRDDNDNWDTISPVEGASWTDFRDNEPEVWVGVAVAQM